MSRRNTVEIDNRDASQMYEYLEARIAALKRRIEELELENQELRRLLGHGPSQSNVSDYVSRSQFECVLLERLVG